MTERQQTAEAIPLAKSASKIDKSILGLSMIISVLGFCLVYAVLNQRTTPEQEQSAEAGEDALRTFCIIGTDLYAPEADPTPEQWTAMTPQMQDSKRFNIVQRARLMKECKKRVGWLLFPDPIPYEKRGAKL